jgi:hypothetical protein
MMYANKFSKNMLLLLRIVLQNVKRKHGGCTNIFFRSQHEGDNL